MTLQPYSETGPFGPYQTMAGPAEAKRFTSQNNHKPIDITTELAYSKGQFGYPFLREHYQAEITYQVVNDMLVGVIRNTGTFAKWLANKGFYSEVSDNIKITNKGLMIGKGKASAHQPFVDLTAYFSDYNCRLNESGKMISKVEDLRQFLGNYLTSKEGQDLMQKLISGGHKPPALEALAEGFVDDGTLMAVGKEGDGFALFRNSKFYEKIASTPEYFGQLVNEYLGLNPHLAEDLAMRSTLAEEITHAFRGIKDRSLVGKILEELATKEFVAEFYKKRKEGAGKDEQRRLINSYLEQIMQEDISTTPVKYARLYSKASKKGYSRSDVNSLVSAYLAEAVSKGYSGKAAVDYAVSKAKSDVKKGKAKGGKKAAAKADSTGDTGKAAESTDGDTVDSDGNEISGEVDGGGEATAEGGGEASAN
ncbi:MAG: hypothetical protein ABIC04_03460 [Nanoarchaeota archaeon]